MCDKSIVRNQLLYGMAVLKVHHAHVWMRFRMCSAKWKHIAACCLCAPVHARLYNQPAQLFHFSLTLCSLAMRDSCG